MPLERVVGLVVHGNVDISSALIREILWRGYGIVWCSSSGRVVGHARSSKSPNGYPRLMQHVRAYTGDLALARELMATKVSNQATQLRRGTRIDLKADVGRMRTISKQIATASSIPEIFGFEGEAASVYFENFPSMVSDSADRVFLERWKGRSGRGASDPLNVALNYAYGLLVADCIRAICAAGLDPHAGFVHSSSRNKPAFALDLMEQFRPVIADSAVLSAINNGLLTGVDFSEVAGSTRLRVSGRKALTSEFERRIGHEFTHPIFKYKISWRRAIEVQARMVLGILDGTRDEYTGIRTR
ncbi:CRISPR-associated endonuclease Cas1 [Gordonia hydrophobica]|nr:CRISPR-associated endonuclease Cas1 [Gordonia hydrophobica]